MNEFVDESVTEDAPLVDAGEEAEVSEVEEVEAEKLDTDKSLEKIRKLNSEAAALRKRTKEAEEKAKNAGDAGERVTALEAENMRLKVAVKLNGSLPHDLIERLRGGTEEEMLEDAEKLLAHFAGSKPPSNQPKLKLRGGGNPDLEMSLVDSDPDKFAESVFKY